MDWALKYTAYLYENNNARPSMIDNAPLYKDNQLRCNMKLNHDFVVVNDVVWLFLKEEYNGGPEVSFETLNDAMRLFRQKQLAERLNERMDQKRVSTTTVPSLLGTPSPSLSGSQLRVPDSPYETVSRSKSSEASLTPKYDPTNSPLQKQSYEIPLVGFKNDMNFCYMHSGL